MRIIEGRFHQMKFKANEGHSPDSAFNTLHRKTDATIIIELQEKYRLLTSNKQQSPFMHLFNDSYPFHAWKARGLASQDPVIFFCESLEIFSNARAKKSIGEAISYLSREKKHASYNALDPDLMHHLQDAAKLALYVKAIHNASLEQALNNFFNKETLIAAKSPRHIEGSEVVHAFFERFKSVELKTKINHIKVNLFDAEYPFEQFKDNLMKYKNAIRIFCACIIHLQSRDRHYVAKKFIFIRQKINQYEGTIDASVMNLLSDTDVRSHFLKSVGSREVEQIVDNYFAKALASDNNLCKVGVTSGFFGKRSRTEDAASLPNAKRMKVETQEELSLLLKEKHDSVAKNQRKSPLIHIFDSDIPFLAWKKNILTRPDALEAFLMCLDVFSISIGKTKVMEAFVFFSKNTSNEAYSSLDTHVMYLLSKASLALQTTFLSTVEKLDVHNRMLIKIKTYLNELSESVPLHSIFRMPDELEYQERSYEVKPQ